VLTGIIAGAFAERTMQDVSAALAAAGVPGGPINPIPAALDDAQARHREMVVRLDHPVAGPVPMIASPMRFRDAPIAYDRAPPVLGEHTSEILAELGIAGRCEGGSVS
jgi:crotonobetainyl-CoA:carnitine CoA-transferase CaiB-like acyl-CoA transferase